MPVVRIGEVEALDIGEADIKQIGKAWHLDRA